MTLSASIGPELEKYNLGLALTMKGLPKRQFVSLSHQFRFDARMTTLAKPVEELHPPKLEVSEAGR